MVVATFSALAILALTATIVFACHAYLTVSTPSCETVASSYEFQGNADGNWYRGVASGDLASFTTTAYRDGAAHTGPIYNGPMAPGVYTETFKIQVAPNVPVYSACPTETFTASRVVYGSWGGWEYGECSWEDENQGTCEDKWVHTWHGGHSERRYRAETTETFGPISVPYGEKSEDPNHCHKPTGESLGVPSWAMSDFNALPQKLDRTVTGNIPGEWYDYLSPQTREVTVAACYVPCSQTTELAPIESEHGTAWNAWGEWVNNYDKPRTFTRTRTGTESWTLTYPVVDKYDTAIVCGAPRVEKVSNPVSQSETLPATYRTEVGADCVAGWVNIFTLDPSGAVRGAGTQGYHWIDPYVLETQLISVPESQQFPAYSGTVVEPSECQQVHQVTYDKGADCNGWVALYAIDGGASVTYASGTWSDPFVLEDADVPAFDIPTNPGEIYNITQIPGVSVSEPAECLEPRPASISVEVGQCQWEEIHGPPWGQSVTRAIFTGVGIKSVSIPDVAYLDPFENGTEIALLTGTYTWSATPLDGYVIVGDSSGTIVAGDCTPPSATVEVAVGTCSWDEQTGSLTEVSFTIDHANVTVEGPGGPYGLTASATLNLGPGSYSYSWVAQEGYIGSGEGSFEVGDCTPDSATVSVDAGVCRWDGETSSTAVTFTLTGGVTVLLNGPDGLQAITESTTLILPPGSYSWSAVADEGYRIVGPAEGSFQLASCEPGDASVLVDLGECRFENDTSRTLVSFTLTGGITVTLTGPDGFTAEFSESGEFNLLPGHYGWVAVAAGGYEIEGPSEGEFDVVTCRPECPTCRCPTCGAPIQETMGESMAIAWFSDLPCTPETCPLFAGQDHNPWVKLWTAIPSSYTEEGVTTPLTTVTTANGEACQVAFFRDGDTIGDFILWGPDGEGDRFRDHVLDSERALHKYSACSIFPSWCDTRLGEDGLGYALWLPGHNTSDWVQWILENGFFPDEEKRGNAAIAWANALRENGKEALLTWDGDLSSLPLFPLPPR